MKKSVVGEAVLLALEKAADGYLALDYFYSHPSQVFYADPPKSNLRSVIYRLGKRGHIEKSINEGKVLLMLTEAGRDWVLKYSESDPKNWDGIWRLVIFDIPESHRKVRGTLRSKLKEWGFTQWQKSVWATQKPLTIHLRKLVADLGVDDWVLVIESSDIGRGN